MKLEKQKFLSAMSKALPGVEKGKSIIEGADTFVLQDNAIHSYNDNISVSVPFELDDDITGSIKSMDFFKLISKMPTDDIEIISEENVFKINSGKTEVELTKIDNKIVEYISTLKINQLQWKDLPKDFFEGLKLCYLPNNRDIHRGAFIFDTRMYSTDTIRINKYIMSESMDRFWLDDIVVSELLKIDNIEKYSVSENWVHFQSKDGVSFSCKRKDDSSYPIQVLDKWLEKVEKEETDIENVFPKGLFNVVDRVSTLSSQLDGLSAIRMTIMKDGIEFYSEKDVTGKIKEVLNFEQVFEKEVNIEIWVSPEFILETSKKVDGFYIKEIEQEHGNKVTLVFYNDKYKQIVSTFDK
jgi:hypothetical protein